MDFIRKSLKKSLNTLSTVIYSSPETSQIKHNFGTPNQYILKGNFFGEDNWVRNLKEPGSLKLILGEDNISLLNKVSSEINSSQMYLWRCDVNSAREEGKKYIVNFWAFPGMFILDCGRSRKGRYPSLRILLSD